MIIKSNKYSYLSDRHREILKRILQADENWERHAGKHEPFHLMHPGDGPVVDHPGWDPSWAVPDATTIDDLGEIELLRVDPPANKNRTFELSMDGRKHGNDVVEGNAVNVEVSPQESRETKSAVEKPRAKDPNAVAVMHGRDATVRDAVFDMLRRWGLKPLDWDTLVDLTGSAAPYNGEAVEAAFMEAQAVVVVVTPDDVGYLHPDLHGAQEEECDREPTGQARLNVVLEAGMALQSHPGQTVFLEIGRSRLISDLAGKNAVRLDGTIGPFESLRRRLTTAGCGPNRSGQDDPDREAFDGLTAFTRAPDTRQIIERDRLEFEHRSRQLKVELSSVRSVVDRATQKQKWWNTDVLLPSERWHGCSADISRHAPQIFDTVAEAYVAADQANKALGEEFNWPQISTDDDALLRDVSRLVSEAIAAIDTTL